MNHHRSVKAAHQLIARTFKSGNSMALRLPKALGFKVGEEVIITDNEDGTFSIRRADDDPSASLDALYGAFSKDFMAKGRGDIEQAERNWSEGRSRGGDA
ncbi:AbrB/MazE/SpoVT family DNA-binding domain-containing protein [Sphingomonas cavernae]|uniref:AbrB/MazE/SpoVT family DNA-binding domain-containing protein n=1 Tax=Sphingomonas cavernae TaxID=2320861 RepID=A0A418WLZ6_9SPHN|nr:AbrB/MazE/SpoVT family DNA-binding domain-containing protein [Sphingomonas cavernae]RJF91033.1 AbrB/MazE/SpoVT family DNA-binding domain-containing protein [Sphingomonas cavernae]